MSDDDVRRPPTGRSKNFSTDELFTALALSIEQVKRGSEETLRSDIPFTADDLTRDGENVGIGRRIFNRWSRALYGVVCRPDSEDKDIQSKLLRALTGAEGGTAMIAGVLVASFGASPAIAAIVAALLIKIVVAPAADELCHTWGKSISDMN